MFQQIIVSNELHDEQKFESLNQLLDQYHKENDFNLLLIFDFQMFSFIYSKLDNCKSALEFALINVLEYISERDSQMLMVYVSSTDNYKTLIFDEIKQSGVVSKIE